MPFTKRKLNKLAEILSLDLRKQYEYYDATYQGKIYVSRDGSDEPESQFSMVSIRGRDLMPAIEEYYGLLLRNHNYAERFSEKIADIRARAKKMGIQCHEGDYLRFITYIPDYIGKKDFDNGKTFFGRIFHIVHKEYFTLVPINYDDRNSSNIEANIQSILHSLECLIPLAIALEKLSAETKSLIDFKILADPWDYLYQEDTLVIHYQKNGIGSSIKQITKKILSDYGVKIVNREIKKESGFDIFEENKEKLTSWSYTNTIGSALALHFKIYLVQIFEKYHGWGFFGDPIKREFDENIIFQELMRALRKYCNLTPKEIIDEIKKMEVQWDQFKEEIKKRGPK